MLLVLGLVGTGCGDASGRPSQDSSEEAGSPASGGGADSFEDVAASLEARLDSLSDAPLDSVYGRPATPFWVDESGPIASGRSALEELAGAEAEGLHPSRYDLERLRALGAISSPTAADLARLDIGLTRGMRLLTQDLAAGIVASTSFDPEWRLDSLDHPGLPAAPGSAQPILDHLERVRPKARQYGRLQEVLVELRKADRSGGWDRVEVGDAVLASGDSAIVVAGLRARLLQSLSAGERRLAGEGRDRPAYFDEALARSLALFQGRHDIVRDGILGPETAAALNTPVGERIGEVELALERWRWLPADLGSLAVVVNTPGRRVHVLRDGAAELSMKSIIGQRDWKTALFQDEMEEVVINPYWNVPRSIMAEETLPRALEDTTYLRENDYEVVDLQTDEVVPLDSIAWNEVVLDSMGVDTFGVDTVRVNPFGPDSISVDSVVVDSIAVDSFPYRIRQKPGDKNALGKVKFLFPNRFNIYLHDTPQDDLFDERMRVFSHGCVRLERPAELARFLLGEASDRTPAQYDSLQATGERHVIDLEPHVPVYLVYQTVWVDEQGAPRFTPDVYDRNPAAREALAKAATTPGARP